MKRWTRSFALLGGIAFVIVSTNGFGRCQEAKPKFHLESSAGVFLTDKQLAFKTSPSFGLGAGYGITNTLQLSLTFSYIPTQQRLSQAASELTARYDIFNLGLEMKYAWHKPILWRLRPYAGAGISLMTIDPHSVKVALGGGESVIVAPPADRRLALTLGIGLMLPVAKAHHIRFEFKHYYHKLNDTSSGGDSVTATSRQVTLGLAVGL